MTAWVEMPSGERAMRGAALRELDHTLCAIRCVADLLAPRVPAESLALVLTVLSQLERGREALGRLAD